MSVYNLEHIFFVARFMLYDRRLTSIFYEFRQAGRNETMGKAVHWPGQTLMSGQRHIRVGVLPATDARTGGPSVIKGVEISTALPNRVLQQQQLQQLLLLLQMLFMANNTFIVTDTRILLNKHRYTITRTCAHRDSQMYTYTDADAQIQRNAETY